MAATNPTPVPDAPTPPEAATPGELLDLADDPRPAAQVAAAAVRLRRSGRVLPKGWTGSKVR